MTDSESKIPNPMRVLWFSNIVMPEVKRHLGLPAHRGSGHWMISLLEKLKARGDIQLAVATGLRSHQDCDFSADGVQYFAVREEAGRSSRAINKNVRRCAEIANNWRPDLIHFHGTERYFGLTKARGLVSTPTVVSIQGLLSQCARNTFGGLSPKDIRSAHTFYEKIRGIGISGQYRGYKDAAKSETEIIRVVDAVLGRTDWDRTHARAMNPRAPYFHVDEIMREEFYTDKVWQLESCVRHQIMTTTRPQALKGLHVLLDAVAIVRQQYPNVRLKVAGMGSWRGGRVGGYQRFISRRIKDMGISDCVELLGWCDAEDLAKHHQQSHCYVTSSFIENGCNALQEAMLVGTPCVATYTGGMTTTIKPEETGLVFPVGDAALLAEQIRRIFEDDHLAIELGARGREVAMIRHDRQHIVSALVDAYRTVIEGSSNR